jgi:CheY-like chemotaxis protein
MRNQPDSRRLNLLVVEDNLPDALLVKEAIRMEDLPLEVHLITDGQEAIEFIERAEEDPNAPCPHFLVIDLNLPKRSGFEVLQRLRASEKCKTIPALVITSSDSADDRKRAAGCGAGYFRKPPSYEEYMKLGSVLKQLLNETGAI